MTPDEFIGQTIHYSVRRRGKTMKVDGIVKRWKKARLVDTTTGEDLPDGRNIWTVAMEAG